MKFFLFEICRRFASLDFKPAKARKGQTTIEYTLMMASIIGAFLIFAALFYKRLLGGFFTVIGLVIGAGVPK